MESEQARLCCRLVLASRRRWLFIVIELVHRVFLKWPSGENKTLTRVELNPINKLIDSRHKTTTLCARKSQAIVGQRFLHWLTPLRRSASRWDQKTWTTLAKSWLIFLLLVILLTQRFYTWGIVLTIGMDKTRSISQEFATSCSSC